MADIIKIAEQLNSDVTRLNNERSKLEGILESAKISYDKAVKEYEAKYGVRLSEDTLQEEYNQVFARTKGAVIDLQEKIESIKRGDYKKEEEAVEYDLEPNVLPIREEVETKKKKTTRKSKKDKVETPVEENIEEKAEEIESKVEVKEEKEVVIPPVENPFNMDFNFEGFSDTTTINVPKEEKVVEKKTAKSTKSTKKGKPLSGSDLSAAVAAADNIKQNPIVIPELVDEDEVELSNSTQKETKVETEDFGFGSFGDLVGSVESKKEETKKDSSSDLGGFGGFSGFGGFGTDEEDSDEVDIGQSEDSFSFGGLGDLGLNAEEIEETPKEEKKDEIITPEGWGAEVNFGDFGDFGNILDSGNFKL